MCTNAQVLSKTQAYSEDMPNFKVGDCVRWVRDVIVHEADLTGTILRVAYDNKEADRELSLFEVEFLFGVLLLRAEQLVHVSSLNDQSTAA